MNTHDPGPEPKPTLARGAALLFGLLIAGYGALIVLRVLAHESLPVGVVLVLAGLLVAWMGRAPATKRRREAAKARSPLAARATATAGIGAFLAGGVLLYNLTFASTISTPELAILAYGIALIAAAPFLHARVGNWEMEQIVAWSFPLVAAPLGIYALDAILDASTGGSPFDAFIEYGLVAPLAWTLSVVGFDATRIGQAVMLGTPRGTLSLNVGLVCAGLQPGILFLGIFGLYAWQERTPPARLALLLLLGLAGVYLANLLRLVILALVGYQWGGATLQTTHEHAGWVLFIGWMLAYWWLVLRRFQVGGPAGAERS